MIVLVQRQMFVIITVVASQLSTQQQNKLRQDILVSVNQVIMEIYANIQMLVYWEHTIVLTIQLVSFQLTQKRSLVHAKDLKLITLALVQQDFSDQNVIKIHVNRIHAMVQEVQLVNPSTLIPTNAHVKQLIQAKIATY
jgi:hypothetical protein